MGLWRRCTEVSGDVRRLAVLTFPKMAQADREGIACDCFIDALVDPDFILRVRQQNPKTLDEALRVAQRLEIWVKKTENLQSEDRKFKEDRRVREVAKTENSDQTMELATKAQMEALKREAAEYRKLTEEYKKQTAKEIAEYKKQIGQLEGMLQAVTKTTPEVLRLIQEWNLRHMERFSSEGREVPPVMDAETLSIC